MGSTPYRATKLEVSPFIAWSTADVAASTWIPAAIAADMILWLLSGRKSSSPKPDSPPRSDHRLSQNATAAQGIQGVRIEASMWSLPSTMWSLPSIKRSINNRDSCDSWKIYYRRTSISGTTFSGKSV
jgi:hypothetical protein